MKLYDLLHAIEYEGKPENATVAHVTEDSRKVVPGSVFCCVAGKGFDGHDYAAQALEHGAVCVVVQRSLGLPCEIVVKNTRAAYARLCAAYHGHSHAKLTLVGVTGTNGKTTTACLLKQMFDLMGYQTGLIGTLKNMVGETEYPAVLTTPDPWELHGLFAEMVATGCTHCFMEVSSQALDQKRVEGITFQVGVFSNLTQDHLDYHLTMENYYQAKKKLFSMCDTAVINIDDLYGRRLKDEVECKALTFACESSNADYSAHNIKFSERGSSFAFLAGNSLERVNFAQPGLFSVSNALAAGVLCIAAGIELPQVIDGLNRSKGVTGRFEILPTNTDYTVIRDYAHSPDSLEKVLSAIRSFATGRVVTLFGCAGNRDRTKRPMMAEAAAKFSDYCIITSDNPRDEDPEQIIKDALPGIKQHKTPYKAIIDRYEAIGWALKNSQPGDILVLAGKGHEDYQVLDYGTIYFNEREIVLSMLGIEGEV